MESKLAVIAGIAIGGTVKALTGNLYMAMLTASCTGACAYIGQQAIKYIHRKYGRQIKKYIHKITK